MTEKLGGYLVYAVCFLGMFAFLGASLPLQLVTSFDFRNQTTPENFESIDVQYFAETKVLGLNSTGWHTSGNVQGFGWHYRKHVDIGGHDFDVYYSHANLSYHYVLLRVHWTEWIIFRRFTNMDWRNRVGQERDIFITADYDKVLTAERIEQDWEEDNAQYRAYEPAFSVTVYFGYDVEIYSDVIDAWDHDALEMYVGIHFDDISTTQNAWALLAMILFFQSPVIHPMLNFFIALPLWAMIAYLIYRLILMAIPFVGE